MSSSLASWHRLADCPPGSRDKRRYPWEAHRPPGWSCRIDCSKAKDSLKYSKQQHETRNIEHKQYQHLTEHLHLLATSTLWETNTTGYSRVLLGSSCRKSHAALAESHIRKMPAGLWCTWLRFYKRFTTKCELFSVSTHVWDSLSVYGHCFTSFWSPSPAKLRGKRFKSWSAPLSQGRSDKLGCIGSIECLFIELFSAFWSTLSIIFGFRSMEGLVSSWYSIFVFINMIIRRLG